MEHFLHFRSEVRRVQDSDHIGRFESVHPASKNRVKECPHDIAMPSRRSYRILEGQSKILSRFPTAGIEFYGALSHAEGSLGLTIGGI